MSDSLKNYGFEYTCAGHTYTFVIPAFSKEEALARRTAMASAECIGVLVESTKQPKP